MNLTSLEFGAEPADSLFGLCQSASLRGRPKCSILTELQRSESENLVQNFTDACEIGLFSNETHRVHYALNEPCYVVTTAIFLLHVGERPKRPLPFRSSAILRNVTLEQQSRYLIVRERFRRRS